MNKIVSPALLAGGIVLIIVWINATNSFSSDVSKFFNELPTNRAIWMFLGGVVTVIVGLATIRRGARQS